MGKKGEIQKLWDFNLTLLLMIILKFWGEFPSNCHPEVLITQFLFQFPSICRFFWFVENFSPCSIRAPWSFGISQPRDLCADIRELYSSPEHCVEFHSGAGGQIIWHLIISFQVEVWRLRVGNEGIQAPYLGNLSWKPISVSGATESMIGKIHDLPAIKNI